MDYLQNNYNQVKARISHAEKRFHRSPASVSLLAVSKTKPIEMVNALAETGQKAFGENYLQEALEKIAQRPDLEWHFIGPIQSNKTKPIAEHFDWVESVDRLKIAQRLSDQRPSVKPALNILLQVNISQEDSKSGFLPDEVLLVAQQISKLPGLVIRGLMAIPKAETEFEQQRSAFKQMQTLFKQLQSELDSDQIDTLSMGMSADLEAAIAEGSTQVRIGTDLFGARL
ncbi:YggS family pyridoxal phosphate-dependent enzyme [Thiomicrospira microaerophila]|uniref:YggS family pyridoxal phosphate-dependent enzyme n=1 Tax=Thiomicrospira microaerophila TaxID=406020 RepID=UPI00200D5BD9|nr:YggS family pyridoxal phosphate-dependent enzyme [Thiomicrospira microaerophila]UQB41706.1 YggS family pyridoxal phosphate-dependent enzyme [Thiomicrospira microaerophila]